MSLGKRIKEAREAKRYSQQMLAEETGLKQYQIARLETEATKNPPRAVLAKIADALGRPVAWFYSEDTTHEPSPLARLLDEIQRAPHNALNDRQVQALIDFFREFKRAGEDAPEEERPRIKELSLKQREFAFRQFSHQIQEAKIHKLPVLTVENKAAAGPGEYIEEPPEQLVLAQHRWRKGYKPFKITGNSMEPFIMSGDYVVVDLVRPPVDGDIVLARTDDGLVVKKFVISDGGVELVSVNPEYSPVRTKSLSVLGVLVDIVRPLKKV